MDLLGPPGSLVALIFVILIDPINNKGGLVEACLAVRGL